MTILISFSCFLAPQPNNVVDGQNSIPSSSSGERTGSRNAKKWDKSSDARNATIELLAERGNGTKDAVVAETAVEDEDSYDDDYDEESLG